MPEIPTDLYYKDGMIASESDPSSKTIATVHDDAWRPRRRRDAYGRMFAASPKLLEAISPLLDIVENELAMDSEPEDLTSWHRAIADAHAAIDEATGQ